MNIIYKYMRDISEFIIKIVLFKICILFPNKELLKDSNFLFFLFKNVSWFGNALRNNESYLTFFTSLFYAKVTPLPFFGCDVFLVAFSHWLKFPEFFVMKRLFWWDFHIHGIFGRCPLDECKNVGTSSEPIEYGAAPRGIYKVIF